MTCVIANAVWSHTDEAYLCKRCGGIIGRTHDAVRVCDCDRPESETQHAAAVLLRNLMEEISERCYAAGWMMGLEGQLYVRAFESVAPKYGMGRVHEAAELRRLAEVSKSWWHWPDDVEDGPVQITLAQAREIYGRQKK